MCVWSKMCVNVSHSILGLSGHHYSLSSHPVDSHPTDISRLSKRSQRWIDPMNRSLSMTSDSPFLLLWVTCLWIPAAGLVHYLIDDSALHWSKSTPVNKSQNAKSDAFPKYCFHERFLFHVTMLSKRSVEGMILQINAACSGLVQWVRWWHLSLLFWASLGYLSDTVSETLLIGSTDSSTSQDYSKRSSEEGERCIATCHSHDHRGATVFFRWEVLSQRWMQIL